MKVKTRIQNEVDEVPEEADDLDRIGVAPSYLPMADRISITVR